MFYWQQGHQLNDGKFIVEKVLGSGGFGVTYKVKELRSDRFLVVKTLNAECQQHENFDRLQRNFINETIALASCRHSNIVRVYPQMFQEGRLWCMVMDYIDGQDLARYLDTNGRFSEADAIELITKVGNALGYVHQQGFLHRDIKPNNILLRKSDLSPVLIDFGLAREYTSGTIRSMTNAVTECFAPIEQYENRGDFGAWTDVYALAATLYVLVTAELPIPSRFRTYGKLSPPKQHNPNLSDRTNEAILKGMELEPGDRPRSVGEWLDLFKEVSKEKDRKNTTVNIPFEEKTIKIAKNQPTITLTYVLLNISFYTIASAAILLGKSNIFGYNSSSSYGLLLLVGVFIIVVSILNPLGNDDLDKQRLKKLYPNMTTIPKHKLYWTGHRYFNIWAVTISIGMIIILFLALFTYNELNEFSTDTSLMLGLIHLYFYSLILYERLNKKAYGFFNDIYTFLISVGTSIFGLSVGWILTKIV